MGYDDGECAICKLKGGMSNVEGDERCTVYLSCIGNITEEYGDADPRVVHVLMKNMSYGRSKCVLCLKNVPVWFDVWVCEYHMEPEESE